jgi:hypothetical protein
MHKKLASDLTSLAHSILQMKNKEDVLALKAKAYQVYEKLALLAYVDEYLNSTPNATETKEELISKIENIVEVSADKPINIEKESIQSTIEQPFAELEQALFGDENPFEKNDVRDVGKRKTFTLDDELHDTISLDFAAEMFEKVPLKKSLNDNFQGDIQIGLNDRIAFVKHLFDGSQEDFNRVVSQLNTMKTEEEGLKFINKMIKPDYDWSNKEEYEERFLLLITRKFV